MLETDGPVTRPMTLTIPGAAVKVALSPAPTENSLKLWNRLAPRALPSAGSIR